MKKDYEHAIGKVIKEIRDLSNSDHEILEFVFDDDSTLSIAGNSSGHDVWYAGLFYKFTNPTLT